VLVILLMATILLSLLKNANRFAANVERGVDQDRAAGQGLEPAGQWVVDRDLEIDIGKVGGEVDCTHS